MIDGHGTFLLLAALGSVIVLIVLIARYKANPFIALMSVSIALAMVTGMPMQTIVHSFEAGVGGTLGHIAVVIGLGTMLGKMMAESGGADQIAHTLIRFFGEKRVHWAMVVIGFVVGLPVFFEVGFVLLIPIAFTVAKRTRTSLVLVGIPMVAGLSVVHGLVPPHPAALLAVAAYHADVGKTVFYALIVGIPTAILAGPLYAKLISPHIHLPAENPIAAEFLDRDPHSKLPSFALTMATVLLPVVSDDDRKLGQYIRRSWHAAESTSPFARWRRYRSLGRRADQLYHAGNDARIQPRDDFEIHQRVPGAHSDHYIVSRCGRRIWPDTPGQRHRRGDRRCRAACAYSSSATGVVGGRGRSRGHWVCHGGNDDCGWNYCSDCLAGSWSAAGITGDCDRRRIAGVLPRQRWRLLAGEGVFQHERGRYLQDMDGLRNDYFHGCVAVNTRTGEDCLASPPATNDIEQLSSTDTAE